jgi:NAD(P)-dependent dehydrogenase (short-subunit alcohol dehydrogenase family)
MKGQRVALLTGGSSGLGREMALTLAGNGLRVAIAYRQDRLLASKTLNELLLNEDAMIWRADVRRWPDVQRLVAAVMDRFGRIDVLVNNVGDFVAKPFERTSVEEWREMFDSNLHSAYYGCRAVGPIMKKQRYGRIINIGLANADRVHAYKKTLPYAIAKTGVLILTRSLAMEWAPHRITVNALLPGLMDNGSLSRTRRRSLTDEVPAGRPGDGRDLAGALLYLISDEASYVTGAEITVSGGWGL